VTALGGAVLHLLVLRRRLALEDGMLLGDPVYRAAMAEKPRFFPRLLPRFLLSRNPRL
jgi:hypothetical protein